MSASKASQEEEKKDPLLSLIGHEFSTPISVVLGYLKMVLKDQGTIGERQRKMLEDAQSSAGRLSTFVEQLRDLSRLEAGGIAFNRTTVDLAALLEGEITSLPPMPDREIRVVFKNDAADARVQGDPVRLKTAFRALIFALRRELVTTDELGVSLRRDATNGRALLRVTIGGGDRLAALETLTRTELTTFNEFRSGVGFTVLVALRILKAHEAQVWAPVVEPSPDADAFIPDDDAAVDRLIASLGQKQKAEAIVLIPEA